MKSFCLTITLVLLLLPTFLSAQNENINEVDVKGYYLLPTKNNWFISVGGGVQLYYGTEDFKYISTSSLSPAADLSFGKWISPSLGFRVQFAGIQGYGWTSVTSPYMLSKPVQNVYKEAFYYVNTKVDFLWNVLDIGDNYRYSRIFKFIPFIGAGAVSTFSPSVGMEIGPAVSGGFLFNFRCSQYVSLNLELRSVVADGRMDKMRYNSNYEPSILPPAVECMNSATIGIQIAIAPKKFDRRYEITSEYKYKIMELKRELRDQKNEYNILKDKHKDLNQKALNLIKENDELLKLNNQYRNNKGKNN